MNIDMENLKSAFILMGQGMAGVFLVIFLIMAAILLMSKLPENKEKP